MRCFVTVGTTKFDSLVAEVCSGNCLKAFQTKGYTELVIQAGSSEVPSDITCSDQDGLNVTIYEYKSSIAEDIKRADLIISHAGAGSCLEIMHAQKPCIVVINDSLMGNHQLELAEQLAKLGHLVYTTPSNLRETLWEFDSSSLSVYEKGKPDRFAQFLEKVCGIDT